MMEPLPRHQCFLYAGPPSQHIAPVAAAMRQKLGQNYRCLYLNSQPMVAGMGSALAAAGVDVSREVEKGSLILTSSLDHLVAGHFDIDRMLDDLRDALHRAMKDGYAGLWASGDMTWEFGPDRDFGKLLEYEWRLERFVRQNPEMGGVCQYHIDTLPPEAVRQGFVAHPAIFVNETLCHLNPHYLRPEHFSEQALGKPDLELAIALLLQPHPA